MTEYKTNYKNWANWYDLVYEIIKPKDLILYKSLINDQTKDVLEMGIGTGRIFKSFFQNKINWTGIDDSEEMINLCKEKIEPLKPLKGKLKLINEDMTKLDIRIDNKSIHNSKFDLVIYPSNSLMSVGDINQQKNALCSGLKHLKDNGILMFDLHNPNNYEIKDKFQLMGSAKINNLNHEIFGRSEVDFINKLHTNFQKIIINSDEVIELKSYDNFLYIEDVISICDELNIEILDMFGGYNKEKISDNSEEIIFISKKK